jgi:hypothetical protein
MRKLIFIAISGVMLAAPAAASPAASAKQLTVAMRDPGCHWFYNGGGPDNRKYSKTTVRTGPVTLLNLDEAALIIKGPGALRRRLWARN